MIIGIDLGGMSAKAACLDGDVLKGKSRVETNANAPYEKTAHTLAELCRTAARAAGFDLSDAEAIGIGSPGVIDSAAGVVVNWSNFHWENVPLAALVSRETGKPVFVSNDANVAALGEAAFGAGKKYRDSILITIGTGIGGGIVLDGKLFEGGMSAGAELGHTVIVQDGEPCTCGRRGCLERYASATALLRYTREEMERGKGTLLWKYAPTLEAVDGTTVFRALREEDAGARRVFSRWVAALGEGVVNFANIFRPQAFLFGGGISAEGETLLAPLREYVYPRLYVSTEYAPLELVCATLGNDAGLYGAARYAATRLPHHSEA